MAQKFPKTFFNISTPKRKKKFSHKKINKKKNNKSFSDKVNHNKIDVNYEEPSTAISCKFPSKVNNLVERVEPISLYTNKVHIECSFEKENEDDDFVAGTQEYVESKLRTTINEDIKNLKASRKTTKNKNNDSILDLNEEDNEVSNSMRDLVDKNNTSTLDLNEEDNQVNNEINDNGIDDMMDNIKSQEMIEMKHDIDNILVNEIDPKVPTNSDCIVDNYVDVSENKKDSLAACDENAVDVVVDDPLAHCEVHYKLNEKKRSLRQTSLTNYLVNKKNLDSEYSNDDQPEAEQSQNEVVDEMLLNLEKLQEIEIELQHEVPKQHMIENKAGTHPLTVQQKEEFQKYCLLRTDRYTESENQTIMKNWADFCRIHDWEEKDVRPFLYMRHNGRYYMRHLETRKRFVRFIANGLPHRSLFSVYARFRILFSKATTRNFTKKEDKVILKMLKKKPKNREYLKNLTLNGKLNRSPKALWARRSFLQSKKRKEMTSDHSDDETDNKTFKNNKTKKVDRMKKKKKKDLPPIYHSSESICETRDDPPMIQTPASYFSPEQELVVWTSVKVESLIQTLMNLTSCKNVKELKNLDIPNSIWLETQNRIGINKDFAKDFWYMQLHMQLFCPDLIYMNDIIIELIEYFHDLNYKKIKNLTWGCVCKSFDGTTPYFLQKIWQKIHNHADPKLKDANFSDLVEQLYNNYIPILEEKTSDMLLPRLFYTSAGKILCLDKGEEEKISNRSSSNPLFSDND